MSEARGLEQRRREAVRRAVRIALIVTSLAGTPAALFTYASIRVGSPWWDGLRSAPAIVAIVLFAWIAFSMAAMLFATLFLSTICPYFERKVGDIETFGRGRALLRQHRALDDLARRLGVAPLSDFGFADDLDGETLVWHDPADGLVTVNALLLALSEGGCDIRQKASIIADLRKVADALGKACEKGIRFCLLYRPGDGTSAQEWEVRKGTAF